MQRVIPIGFVGALLISATVQSQAVRTAAVEGIVVRSDDGEPLAGAQVTLNRVAIAPPSGDRGVTTGSGTISSPTTLSTIEGQAQTGRLAVAQPGDAAVAGTIQPVTTGMDGKFSFKDVQPGSYRLAAIANNFVRQEYGQRTPNGQGRVLFLNAGQDLKDTVLRLPSTGVVIGRVFDENGQPATGAPVQLIRPGYAPAGRNLQVVGTGTVDDRGDYRIFGVPPGRYYLVAGTFPGPSRPARGGAGAEAVRFGVTYFPNATELEQASTIEVKSGTEAAFDLRTRRQVQTFRVRGRVLNPEGIPLQSNVNFVLSYRTINGRVGSFNSARNFDPATGDFELQDVAPGEYAVTVQIPDTNPTPLTRPVDATTAAARLAAQASRPYAQQSIRVVDGDVEGIVLTLSTAKSVRGRIIVEGQAPASVSNLDRFQLTFDRPTIDPNQVPPVAFPPAADGTFQVAGLREGEYRIQALAGTLPPGLYVKSVRFGGEDILTQLFKFSGAAAGEFEVILRAGTAQIAGTVVDAQSQPVSGIQVILLPNQRNRIDLFRPATTDQNGRFALPNVPPGSYRLFSWEAADTSVINDPEFLKQYEQQGKTVLVTEFSNQNVEVKMIPAQ
jgi:hypothetical protein